MKIDPIGRSAAGWNRWLPTGWLCLALVCVWTFGWTLVHTHQFSMTPPERVVRGLAALGWSNEFYFWLGVVTISPIFLGCFLMGAAIFWLRPNDRMAVFTSIFLLNFGAANSFIPAKEYLELVGDLPIHIALPSFITGMLSFGLLGVFFAMYPDGQFVPGWMRWIALEGFLLSLAWNLFPATIGAFEGPLGIVTLLAVIIMFAGGLAAQVWRYRNYSTNLQKQQTKWFVYGLAVIVIASIVPSGILYAWNSNDLTDPRTSVLFDLFLSISNLTFGLLPVTIGVAILRYRLWDIDIIIRRTLVYGSLSAVLGLAYFGGVTVLQNIFTALSGQSSTLALVISTLAIAALFNPLRRRVQAFIDRRFYRQKYDAEKALAEFAAAARQETDLAQLSTHLTGTLQETLQPEQASLWLFRDGKTGKMQ